MNGEEQLLLLPGPSPAPPEVRRACARPVIPHRGAAYEALHAEVTARLKRLFGTAGEVVVLPCSGTGALEAAVINALSPGDRVLACVAGAFGERFAAVAEALGCEVERLRVPWGAVPDPDDVARALRRASGPVRAVLVTHSETSTGALLPVPEIAARVRETAPDALVLADMVSSFAGLEVRVDAWGVDVAVTASQKALMTPPGLGVVALGPRGLKATRAAGMPRYSWDLRRHLERPGKPPYTPAVSLWFGLQAALERLAREGEAAVYGRHRRMSAMARAAFAALGMPPLAAAQHASPTVTAARVPEGTAARVLARLRERHGVVLAAGQGALRGRLVRLGHMGAVMPEHLERAARALDEVATALGLADAPAAAAALAELERRGYDSRETRRQEGEESA